MTRASFSLTTMFCVVALAAVFSWYWSSPSFIRFACLFTFVSWAVAASHLERNPVAAASIAGAIFVVALILIDLTRHWLGYFSHEQPWPYFEDGIVNEFVFFPIVQMILYCPMGALLSAILSLFFVLPQMSAIRRKKRRAQSGNS